MQRLTRLQVLYKRKPVQFLPPADVPNDDVEVFYHFQDGMRRRALVDFFCASGVAYSGNRRSIYVV